MKKLLFSIVFLFIVLTSFGQDSATTVTPYKDEFGLDITGLIQQFLLINQGEYDEKYAPTYYLTYRRHFKSGNIRAAIGCAFENKDQPAYYEDDSNKYKSRSFSFDIRMGWEFISQLSKRWQIFYGLDFRPSYYYLEDDFVYLSGSYATGKEIVNQQYGVAPLLGIRFKFSDRLSLTTEASFSVNYSNSWVRTYYTPIQNTYPTQPDEIVKTKSLFSSFSQPLSLILTFDL